MTKLKRTALWQQDAHRMIQRHADALTNADGRQDEISLDEVERVQI